MPGPEKIIDELKQSLESKVELIVSEFMSQRKGKASSWKRFSDITVQTRRRKGGLTIEWGYRLWRAKTKNNKRYRQIYVSRRGLLQHCKEWEEDEVKRVRTQLDALTDAHKKLRRVEAQLGKFGLLGRDEDILAGFIPEWKSPAIGVMSKAGRDDGDE